MKIIFHPTSTSPFPKGGKQIVHIKTVENAATDRPLTNGVPDTKHITEDSIPVDIVELMNVYEEEESHKDDTKGGSDELLEKEEYLTIFKALLMSIMHPNTSEPFLKKYPTVSITPQVHMVVEHCS